MNGTTLRIVPSYTEAGYFQEANCVTITDGERTAVYVPHQIVETVAFKKEVDYHRIGRRLLWISAAAVVMSVIHFAGMNFFPNSSVTNLLAMCCAILWGCVALFLIGIGLLFQKFARDMKRSALWKPVPKGNWNRWAASITPPKCSSW